MIKTLLRTPQNILRHHLWVRNVFTSPYPESGCHRRDTCWVPKSRGYTAPTPTIIKSATPWETTHTRRRIREGYLPYSLRRRGGDPRKTKRLPVANEIICAGRTGTRTITQTTQRPRGRPRLTWPPSSGAGRGKKRNRTRTMAPLAESTWEIIAGRKLGSFHLRPALPKY